MDIKDMQYKVDVLRRELEKEKREALDKNRKVFFSTTVIKVALKLKCINV